MAVAFIQRDNLYFVPILRNRLEFAELVRRAFVQLDGSTPAGGPDLFAVEMSDSFGRSSAFVRALEALPRDSVLLSNLEASPEHEVLAVTPCDGVIEALRIAKTCSVKVEYIDQDLAPERFLPRQCVTDPNWPDDSLVHVLGIDHYLELIHGHLACPPVRVEPTDTLRELYMADRLRRLQPFYRRIMVVCHAALVSGIMKSLSVKSQKIQVREVPPVLKFRNAGPLAVRVLLKYLDDYPRLVEHFEERRSRLDHEFHKKEALLRAIQEAEKTFGLLRFSTRQHLTFTQFLANLLLYDHHACPRPDVLYETCSGCFDRIFAEHLYAYLTGYSTQLRAECVKRGERQTLGNASQNGTATSDFELRTRSEKAAQQYVGRSCGSGGVWFEERKVGKLGSDRDGENSRTTIWPGQARFLDKMQRKLEGLVHHRMNQIRSRMFSGSLEGGVDIRRTLRSLFSGENQIYVRTAESRPELIDTDEPTVWAIYPQRDAFLHAEMFDEKTYNESGSSSIVNLYKVRYRSSIYSYDNELVTSADNRGVLTAIPVAGFVTFCPAAMLLDDALAHYKDSFEHRFFDHTKCVHSLYGCIHPEIVKDLAWDPSWFEIALLTALRHCKNSVLCVLPDGVPIPSSVTRHPFAQSKSIIPISLSNFTGIERAKLSFCYQIKVNKVNNFIPPRELDRVYGSMVKPFFEE